VVRIQPFIISVLDFPLFFTVVTLVRVFIILAVVVHLEQLSAAISAGIFPTTNKKLGFNAF